MVTLDELRKGIAKELNIKGRWKMKKADLEAEILRIQNGKKSYRSETDSSSEKYSSKDRRPIPAPRNTPQKIERPIPAPRNIPQKTERPIPAPRNILPKGVRPIPAPRNILPKGVRSIPVPKTIPQKTKRPIPVPKTIPSKPSEESWFDWFARKLLKVGDEFAKLIPEGKMKENANKLLNLIRKDKKAISIPKSNQESEAGAKSEAKAEVEEFFKGKIKNIRIKGKPQIDIPTFLNRNKQSILRRIQKV